VLAENGVQAEKVEAAGEETHESRIPVIDPARRTSVTDMVASARMSPADHIAGREAELDRVIHVLLRRTRNNVLLVGEPGVGKDAIVRALAGRIADGDVPSELVDRALVELDPRSDAILGSDSIFYLPRLFHAEPELLRRLIREIPSGKFQLISTCTPQEYADASDRSRWFEAVFIEPPGEEEALGMVGSVKESLEKFHGVVFSQDAIETAVRARRSFSGLGCLPGSALDLLDEAGTRVKIHADRGTPQVQHERELQKKIRKLVHEMETAIANHDFVKARSHSEAERALREELRLARIDPPQNSVEAGEIVAVLADRSGLSTQAVKTRLEHPEQWNSALLGLAGTMPQGKRAWVEGLAGYLSGCSEEEAERLAQAILAARRGRPTD
jgi:ATP-dependent Clp protease ATP-binding subunit ClpC